jgi:hypothetical protein
MISEMHVRGLFPAARDLTLMLMITLTRRRDKDA